MCIPTDQSTMLPFQPLRPSLIKAKGSGRRRYTYGEKSTTDKSVSFGTVESKTYATIRGHSKLDAPHPLSLGWTCVEQTAAISVDDYESQRPSQDRPSSEELITDAKERKKMIKNSELKSQGSGNSAGPQKQKGGLPSKVFKLLVPSKLMQAGRTA